MSSAICFNLDKSKISSSGKVLNADTYINIVIFLRDRPFMKFLFEGVPKCEVPLTGCSKM